MSQGDFHEMSRMGFAYLLRFARFHQALERVTAQRLQEPVSAQPIAPVELHQRALDKPPQQCQHLLCWQIRSASGGFGGLQVETTHEHAKAPKQPALGTREK